MKRILLTLSVLLLCNPALRAQSVCDSLDVKVSYHPFNDSLIGIHVINHSSVFFNYPSFILFNSNNDTVAKENVSLFGMAQSSSHVLMRYPNMPAAASFSGRLEFYSDSYDTLRCTFPMDFDLCPDTCQQAIVYLGNMGSATFSGSVHYDIENSNAQIVASGVLQIASATQHDADTLCLSPGSYQLRLSQVNLTTGGAKFYGITQGNMPVASPSWNYNMSADTTFSFNFYKQCAITSGVNDISGAQETFKVYADGGTLEIIAADRYPIESVMIYTIDGRIITNERVNSMHYKKYVHDLASGIYMVKVKQQGKYIGKKVFIAND